MSTLARIFTYILHPNPGNAYYTSTKALVLLVVCAGLVLASFVIRFWRKKLSNPITKKLSRSWASAALWFGIVGLVLVVCRVEQISFLSMRLWWLVWLGSAALYIVIQFKLFRARHYEKLPMQSSTDPRATYLPKKKKR